MEEYDNLPAKIKAILDTHNEEKDVYKEAKRIQGELNAIGWTCDYGLCGGIFDIKEIKPKITASTFIEIGRLFEEFCGGSKKEEPSEADKLRSEITFLREELNKHREEFKQQKSIKSREEIEDQISKQVVMKLFSSSKEAKETRGVAINVLNWVLNKD